MKTLRGELEKIIQSKHLLSHSFYQKWQHGELSLAELQGYAKEYYFFEKEFPRFVSQVHTKMDSLQMRQMLLENLIHEEQGEENHVELWLRFAEGLGVSREELQNHFHSDQTEHLLRTFRALTQQGEPIEGLSALYAYERQQPDVARQKIDGLARFYQITDDRTTAFFRAHQMSDIYHAETEAKCIELLDGTPETRQKSVAATHQAIDALYEFLTGVEQRYGSTVN